uniref:Uncharacterized protein n=1 Tax=Anguilla anguilla TaxID=7936 RepID=A0A0E9RZL3_ANGAN
MQLSYNAELKVYKYAKVHELFTLHLKHHSQA